MSETQEQRSQLQEQIAREAIPRFRALADEIAALYEVIFERSVRFEIEKGADVMPLAFVTKQREHMHSMLILIDADLHRDALLISRSMLEIAACLQWAFYKRTRHKDQTKRWLYYQVVVELRRLRANEREGMIVDPDTKTRAEKLLNKLGSPYYRHEIKQAISKAKEQKVPYVIPDDPWDDAWTDVSIRDMFTPWKGEAIYDGSYKQISDWVHSGPESIFDALDIREGKDWGIKGFTGRDARSAALALCNGCLSFVMVLRVVNSHFSLGHEEIIETFSTTIEEITQ